MPSIRKRIGYLPSLNAQERIKKISNKEKLSQSKVVGILVEEALIAREGLNIQNRNNEIRKYQYDIDTEINELSSEYKDIDELISDKGITYERRKYTHNSNINLSERTDKFNEELFEEFKQFILFKKMAKDK